MSIHVDWKEDKVADKIVAILWEEPTITTPRIAEKLQMSDSGVRKIITRLKAQGIVQRVGANKTATG